jgi:small basic protein
VIYLVPLLALVLGAAIAIGTKLGPLPGNGGQFFALACLAGLDSVFGGIRGALEGKFRSDVLLTGFVSNIFVALLLAWIGDRLYLDLYIAVALVLGARIFTNLSLIRRFLLTKISDTRERKRLQAMVQQNAVNQSLAAGKPEPNS